MNLEDSDMEEVYKGVRTKAVYTSVSNRKDQSRMENVVQGLHNLLVEEKWIEDIDEGDLIRELHSS